MSEQTPESTPATVPLVRRRILWRLFLSLCLFSLIAFSLLAWYVTTDSFQQRVRRQVVASVEKMTGGRVELGELHTIPFRLRVDARNVTIHGHEASDQAPFLHIERLQAQMKIISLLSTTVGLHSLVLDHPVVHVIAYPDGSTNVPAPHVTASDQNALEQLVALSVSHIAVERGELLWEDKKVPFEFDARDLALLLHYSLLRRRYEAHIVAGSVATQVQDYPSFVWGADASLILAREHADISSLRLTSGQSEILFAGSVHDFHNPQLSGNYHGQAEFSEIAACCANLKFREALLNWSAKLTGTSRLFQPRERLQRKTSNGRTRSSRCATAALQPDSLLLPSISIYPPSGRTCSVAILRAMPT